MNWNLSNGLVSFNDASTKPSTLIQEFGLSLSMKSKPLVSSVSSNTNGSNKLNVIPLLKIKMVRSLSYIVHMIRKPNQEVALKVENQMAQFTM